MIGKKAMLLGVVGLVIVTAGCVPTREHNKQVDALKSRLDNEQHRLAEAERELKEIRQAYEQKAAEADRVKTEAAELGELSGTLEQAKQERERRLREMEALVKDISGMRIEPRAEGDFIVIEQEILFDPGKIELRETAKNTIRDAVLPYIREQLERSEEQMVRVDGHTDGQPIAVSPWKDNYHLSVMRAHSVMKFLVEEGISSQNLFLAGYGPNRPVVEPPEPEAAVEENRRVEILLIPIRGDDIQKILDDFVR